MQPYSGLYLTNSSHGPCEAPVNVREPLRRGPRRYAGSLSTPLVDAHELSREVSTDARELQLRSPRTCVKAQTPASKIFYVQYLVLTLKTHPRPLDQTNGAS
ncbi:hypothetical protein HAX54_049722 [Datura stramonium]|uniref:Uncharacterized protein n=1 Tax=Datura stramonium TaxID=4076 RepID=A0ABS8RU73_DATST|nr:hypothetical protein [Datura stramonium]